MKLSKLLKGISCNEITQDCEVASIIHDSRKVKKGSLFVAIKGMKSDGHDYILDAVSKGAVAVMSNGRSLDNLPVPVVKVKNTRACMSQISANFYDHPSKDLNVIGVTGTNGKTSVTQLLYNLLNKNDLVTGTLGTLGFSTPTGMSTTGFTTPESVELHQLLQMMKLGGVENAVMEISSHALELNRVDDVNINIAIFTNLSQDHLDFHGSMENYFQAKLKLFSNLDESSIAIVNMDDEYGKRILKNINCQSITYGVDKNADLLLIESNLSIDSTNLLMRWKNQKFSVTSNLIGSHNVENLLASIATALVSGISIYEIQSCMKYELIIPGRMEKVDLNEKGIAIIDYAHTPDAYDKTLFTIKNMAPKEYEIITVFGCGGDRDKEKRPIMGQIAEKYSDKLIITSDNPRFEELEDIIVDIEKGLSYKNYKIIKNRREAILNALNDMTEKTILVILGKGRDDYELIGDKKIKHSDFDILNANLK